MTMLDTLFGLIPAASRGQQWVADELQLVNWGGYDGAHRVRFSPRATLLCGGSGSGKSTLMDAYIALMMPHTTPFNGASNGAVAGRSRGDEQRNILSYGRGKLDESRTDTGTQVRVLRGDGEDTWTAIAATWTDHDGSQFTAVRAWYIPATARLIEDTVRVRATADGPFTLSSLETAAAQRLSDAAVRATGLDTYSTDREFSAKLHSVLGIGAAGAGSKAMSLLARIQSGQQITTVDELYKRMVLEEPESLATADAVVEHFDELEGTRKRMVMAQRQVRALRPIRDLRGRIDEAGEQLRLIDDLGRFDDPTSLASLWRTERRLELLRAVEAELQQDKAAADTDVRTQHALAAATESERDGLIEVLRSSGGDQVETAERELAGLQQRLDSVTFTRNRFEEAIAPLGQSATTARQFRALVAEAQEALATPDAKAQARDAYADARAASKALREQVAEMGRTSGEAKELRGNIPASLQQTRELLAEASGIPISELPFVGELIEVLTEFEPWRQAFNLALGGFATTLLIDRSRVEQFRQAINDVRLPVRLRYESVHTGGPQNRPTDQSRLPGRLDYRETPFTGWLMTRLEDQFGFVCVDSATGLATGRMALTITGQVSQGNRGAHGGHGRTNVLGFSNARRLADLDTEVAELGAKLAAARETEQAAAAALDALDARHAAYAKISDLTWDQIDVATITAQCDKQTQLIADLLAGSPKLESLQADIARLKHTMAEQQKAIGRAEARQEKVAHDWAHITDEVDEAQRMLDEAEDAARELGDAQRSYLTERCGSEPATAARSKLEALARFDAAVDSAARVLRDDQALAVATLAEQRAHLGRALESFLETWPNPNLRADPDASLADFERILTELEASGLHELEAEWKNSLLKLSGNDLTNLDSTLSRSLREIKERIEPINAIMRDLPFYDDDHRLQITPREAQSDARRRFRAELRDVRALIAGATTDVEREHAYARMTQVIARIRRTAPDFAELIDVRNHVRVSAEKVHAHTHAHAALYGHIGEKSGGESQELIAFIVGAALRYQLGDADAERPRYAPVFLDEALIKADAHFTKRAIGAWRGLGFQLIIGAPNDKYSAIEPHVDVEYDILKDTTGRSWAKPKVGLASA